MSDAGAVQTARPESGSGAQTPVLRIEHLSKTFPGTKALDDVALEVAEGEIHALVGQNGSGKSTLIKVLAGYHQADPGSHVWLNGEEFDVAKTTDARHNRLRFVHQDLGLFLELSAVDNLALRGGFLLDPTHRVKWKAQAELTRTLLAPFDLDLDVNRPMSEATPVQRTIVAIAAALAGWEGGPGVLVLDEPTAVLPPSDVERLLEIVERVRSRGTSIVYVSHRLDEVFRVADTVTVLRGGKLIVTVSENISVSGLDRVSRSGVVRRPAERRLVDKWMKAIEVKAGSERQAITTLSGGNQQKVIMARCLARDPRVLVLCEPTAGVDVGTRQAIYEFIAERARAGLSLIVSSSDTGDLLAICTRVLVMCNGRVVRELTGDEITEQALLHAMEETEQK
jgi:ABC-type sugar transport system ATPase subunit